ncbi:DNA-binding domain-containing protein [Luteibacter yeojuensis]|uniref:DUF2063 domain-containing protein n=1 Tax=Luteibacter yeojuensis TaxID=345309 RepID=A0A7X5QVC5_9GAMM|nr:DNA-binding domain-containing protein [Luteibacter yeojuensis]NID16088.1 DUF2063 domain-containing protein [Luteibacter yeojuensis]
MSGLASFQRDFAGALFDETSLFGPAGRPAFAIYRNTVMRACLDALEANFPAVACLVGRDWFRAAAAVHVADEPPRDARLATYGEAFPAFLAGFEPAAALPYLADVARLDRLWSESLHAADATALGTRHLASLAPQALAGMRPRLHPATRGFASALPARTIWQASRQGEPVDDALAWDPEYAVVVRVGHDVRVLPAGAADIALLEACEAGATLGEATLAVAEAHPDARIDLILSGLLQSGAFATS